MINWGNLYAFVREPWFLALLAGAVMIAIFARRRLEVIASQISLDNASLLNTTNASLIVGRRQFNQAYVVYLAALLLIYLVLCLVQPIAGYVGNPEISRLWATPSGPFAVAAFIVAVGPNAGWFEKLETAIRRLAHRLAGIPEDLLLLLNVIKRFNLFDPSIAGSLPWEPYETGDQAERAALIVGFDAAEARALEHNIVATLALHSWVAAESGKAIWSEVTRSRFASQIEQLKKDVRRFRNSLEILLKDTQQAGFYPAGLPLTDTLTDADLEADRRRRLSELRAEAEGEITPIRARWDDCAEQAATLATQYRVIFALFTVNDKNPNYDKTEQAALAAILEQVWRPRINRTLNMVLLSTFLGLLGSFVAVFGWKLARYYFRGDTVPADRVLSDAVVLGLNNSVGTVFTLVVPVFLIVLIRFYKMSDRSWVPLASTRPDAAGFPFVQAVRIVIYAILTSAILTSSWFLMTQMISNPENFRASMQQFLGVGWGNKLLVSGAGGILACAVCYALDRSERGGPGTVWRLVLPVATSLLVAVYVAVIHLGLPSSPSFFTANPQSIYKSAAYDLFIQDILVYAAFALVCLTTLAASARK